MVAIAPFDAAAATANPSVETSAAHDNAALPAMHGYTVGDTAETPSYAADLTVPRSELASGGTPRAESVETMAGVLVAVEESADDDDDAAAGDEASGTVGPAGPGAEWVEYWDESAGASYFFNTVTQVRGTWGEGKRRGGDTGGG